MLPKGSNFRATVIKILPERPWEFLGRVFHKKGLSRLLGWKRAVTMALRDVPSAGALGRASLRETESLGGAKRSQK